VFPPKSQALQWLFAVFCDGSAGCAAAAAATDVVGVDSSTVNDAELIKAFLRWIGSRLSQIW